MNLNQYSCNVVMVGLMFLLCSPATDDTPVSLYIRDSSGRPKKIDSRNSSDRPIEIDFRYGNFKVIYDSINSSNRRQHVAVLYLIMRPDIFIPFIRGWRYLYVHLI